MKMFRKSKVISSKKKLIIHLLQNQIKSIVSLLMKINSLFDSLPFLLKKHLLIYKLKPTNMKFKKTFLKYKFIFNKKILIQEKCGIQSINL